MNQAAVKEFFDAWSIYGQVVDLNYMFHNEIYGKVAALLQERFAERAISILDLGCGSARHLTTALQGRNVSRYVGYDLAATALGEARRNLASLNCPLDLRQADLFEGVNEGDEEFDLIFSSFALHHLPSTDKERFFSRARQRLKPKGLLLVIDVARAANEDRPTYLDNYCGWIQSSWTRIPQPALDSIFEHIRGNDFPESDATMCAMAVNGGFDCTTTLARFTWHSMWVFDRIR